MTDTQPAWQQIWLAWKPAQDAIPRSSQPSDGMPTGSIDPRKSPVNDAAQSWCAEVEQAAFGWGEAANLDDNIRWLTKNTPDADPDALEEFTTLSERLAREATRWIPAETRVQTLEPEQTKGQHCATIEELAWVLNSMNKKTPYNTLKSWAQRGHLTKTENGYPLTQALERINK